MDYLELRIFKCKKCNQETYNYIYTRENLTSVYCVGCGDFVFYNRINNTIIDREGEVIENDCYTLANNNEEGCDEEIE